MPLEDQPVTPSLPDTQALDVVLRRSVRQVGRWESVAWDIAAVALRGDAGDRPAGETVTYSGIPLRLYRDQVEDYHMNLASGDARLFLICSRDPDDDALVPRLATLSQGEAVDYMETDDEVLSVPLAGTVRQWAEAWAMLAPIPAPERKKRRQRNDNCG